MGIILHTAGGPQATLRKKKNRKKQYLLHFSHYSQYPQGSGSQLGEGGVILLPWAHLAMSGRDCEFM